MDHSHLVANYSFDSHYDSAKNQTHTESGYDSLLATSVNSFYQNHDSNDSNLFSLPSTPVKSAAAAKFIYNGNNCSTTPDFKQQFIADINGLYFKTIRGGGSCTNSPQSDQFSSSSQSQSPKSSFCPNMDSNLYTRDTLTSKLLRSPAFKIEQSPLQVSYQPIERPSIKSFSSRFTEAALPKPTPTEAEFMDLLISNHCMPDNPEFLIGRRMGVDNVNVLGKIVD